jgi:two-component system phosphate regulon sensor histidine kinase PhoR
VKLGIRGKLFAISLGLIGLAAVISGVLVETVMRQLLTEQLGEELERLAGVSSEAVEHAPGMLDLPGYQALAKRLGKAGRARVTLIDATGKVLGDSALSSADVAKAESHADRPEVQLAQRGERGTATRYSATLGRQMMYLAVPFQRPEGRGVVRVAMSLHYVDALIAQMRWLITGAVLLGLAVAAMMGGLASYFASRSLMRLVARARALASGAGGERLSVDPGDELGGLAGSFNHMADELERTVRTLSGERDRMQAILESLTDAVLAIDNKVEVTEMNRSAMRLLGLTRVPSGTALLDVIRVPQLLEIVERAKAGETAQAEFVWHGPPRRSLLATAAPEGSRKQCVLVLRDVSELRKLETMRRDFVANVSHELRTPVSIISANVETLAGGALSDPQRSKEFLGAVQRNAERLSRLVNDLLDLSRLEAGSYEVELKPMTAEAPVGAVLDLLETRANGRGLSFEVAVEDDLEFVADARSLEHVLVNLVDNAIKYTPKGGAITLEARRDGEHALFEISDTGPGVPESHRARLFERFYRVDPGRSRDMGGTGLGLSIVKHLVEAMHGQVDMRPRSGGGSVFWVRLPVSSARARSEQDAAVLREHADTGE